MLLVEHSFVTPLPEDDMMREASTFLGELGFRPAGARRARRRPRAHRGLPRDFVPQKVTLEFDRGRVSAAIAIQPRSKRNRVHEELLTAVVTGLERLLAHGAQPQEARQQWDELVQRERRRMRRMNIIAGCVLTAIVGVIATACVLA